MSNTQSQGREKIQNVYLKWHNGHRPLSGFVKDIEALLDTLIADTDRESRLDELKMWQRQWFELSTTVPRMQASPKPLREYVMDRIKALSTITAGDGDSGLATPSDSSNAHNNQADNLNAGGAPE